MHLEKPYHTPCISNTHQIGTRAVKTNANNLKNYFLHMNCESVSISAISKPKDIISVGFILDRMLTSSIH